MLDKQLKTKYIFCIAIAAVLSVALFSAFFVFGQNGVLGRNDSLSEATVADVSSNIATPKDEKAVFTETIKKYESCLASPYMMNVTKDEPIPSDYAPTLTQLDGFDGIFLQTEAAQKLSEFIAEAKAQGITLVVFSGYRTAEEQQKIYDETREQVRAAGFTDEKIIEQKTQLACALPGYSEHQTGLSVDIGQTTSKVASEVVLTEFYKYAQKNIYKYGFIISYPENSYTGYEFMPWHFRYIGDATEAQYIMEKGLSLEGYIENIQAQIEADKARLEELENEQ